MTRRRSCTLTPLRSPVWITPVTLTGRVVRLEPLAESHAPGLHAAAEPDLFKWTPQAPAEWSIPGFAADVRRVNTLPDTVAFAMVLIATGEVIGRTTYMDIRTQSRGVEIGRTWIARRHQGTAVNPDVKYTMLRHAFEVLSPTAIRVQLCTGGNNLHSQHAIAKLGAVREGVLRNHRVLPDGSLRDTVVFSITRDEWPGVKRSLEQRLSALGV